jgi:PAS domain S-box-containing protein
LRKPHTEGIYAMTQKVKEKIKELEQRNNFIADNLSDAIWVVDAKTLKYDFITPSVEKITGYTADEYINSSVKDRLTPDSFQKVKKALAEEVKRFKQGVKAKRTLELELIHKDGSVYWIETKAKLYKENGHPLKIIGVTRNINERKNADQKQNELIQELGKALAEKEKLLEENKVLRGLLPICSGCKRIRDEHGKWWPLDVYITKNTDTEITHTICPGCTEVFYPDL